MAKRGSETRDRFLRKETAQGILAVLFGAFGVILALAAFGKAGIAGEKMYETFTRIVGIGFFLLPLLSIAASIGFLRARGGSFPKAKAASASVLLLCGLGIIDLVFPTQGGSIGTAIGAALSSLFGIYAALVILAAIFIIALLILSNASLPLAPALALLSRMRRKKTEPKIIGGVFEEVGAENGARETDDEETEEKIEEKERTDKKEKSRRPEKSSEEETDLVIAKQKSDFPYQGSPYTPPPLSLLEGDRGKPGVGDIKANANIIKRTLQNFGIEVEMDEVSIGPSVTRYALKPAEGVKLSRIVALQNDLALALAAHPIRIEAPIPGKSLVGIEIPNKIKATVGLATMLGSIEFRTSEKPLLLSLGKDLGGKPHFANLSKMPHLLIAGATGSGKTCGKDTYVFSEKGIVTFDEVCPLPLNSEVSYRINIATRDGIEKTSKNYNNGICDFLKITTADGLEIEVTHEHPLWTIQGGKMGWQNGGSIKTGQYVAISRGAKIFGVNEKIHFAPKPNKTNKARSISIPDEMSEALGLFIGLLTADGGLTIHNRIVYTQANEEVLGIYTKLLKDLFGIDAPRTAKSGASNKAKDVIVHSKNLKDFLAHLGVYAVGARDKEIPRSIRQSAPETITAFIKGLMRNDGHISSRGIEVTLASEKLLKQLQIIFLNFGIVSSIHKKTVKGYEHNTYWRLAIYGSDIVSYAKEIGFLTEEEKNKAEKILRLNRNTNKDVIPTVSQVLRKLYLAYRTMYARLTNTGWQYQKDVAIPKYAFNSLRSYHSGERNPSYEALDKILTFYGSLFESDSYQKIAEIKKDNFYWAKVTTIEKTRGVGYDFEVPGSNSFVGNGFVNHNSVTIHTLITSLLFRNSPDALKLILIDPKRVELTLYNKIPHLLTPVITDAKKTILALKWAAKEMDRRYDILESESVRDIHSYHKNVLEPELKKAERRGKEDGENRDMPERLPYIVIIIDELADIMTLFPRELETAIVRLAQMSRATGIHLILSTQRPSVNIITGLIKANISARIALQVSSQIDSRTILDTGGAEKLLGAGDLLFLSGEMSKPMRLQSAYVSEGEVKKLTAHLAKAYRDEPPSELTISEEGGNGPLFEDALRDSEIDDDLYETAREAVCEAGKASTSYLQRKLRIGYSRAARLMDMLEERGVIGAADGSKPRSVAGASRNDASPPEEDEGTPGPGQL